MPELTDLPELDQNAARDWIARWDRQQEVYLPDREDRFTALIDAVEDGTGRPDPLVIDLGRGPGSLSARLLGRLPAAELGRLYAALAGLLRPGGLFLDGDHLRLSEAENPVLSRLERALEDREDRRRFPDGHAGRAEDWGEWWQAVAADSSLAVASAARERRTVHHHGEEGTLLGAHDGALRAAGFAEVGTLWQRGENRILAAVR
jgi:hypothetical protein